MSWSRILSIENLNNRKDFEDMIYYNSIKYSPLDWDRLMQIYDEMLERGEFNAENKDKRNIFMYGK